METLDTRSASPALGLRLLPLLLAAWISLISCCLGDNSPESSAGLWSLKPIQRPPIPSVEDAGWARNPIDRFVFARLHEEGLEPSPPADRVTMIRRLHFNLLGLPPSPEEVRAFVMDPAEDAYEVLVERLLASPHYGERWARHWLDVVRFAESHGFETNLERKNAWPYRDYVIRAFNEDKPYDQFIRDQLAGDLSGEDAATGFLVAGPWDAVKSPDIELTLQQRMDELHDMVSTAATAFLGLTAGCARCHDHKFDPITQEDYYELQAVFAGVQHGERKLKPPDYKSREAKAERERERIRAIERELASFEPLARPETEPDSKESIKLRPSVHPARNVERFPPIELRYLRFTILETTDVEPCIDELEVFGPSDPQANLALGERRVKPAASGTYPNSEIHRLEHINDGEVGNSRSWISNENGKGWVELEFPETVTVDRVVWARDRTGQFKDRLAVQYRIEVAVKPDQWIVVADSTDRRSYDPEMGLQEEVRWAHLTPSEREQVDALLKEKEEREKRAEELTQYPAIYAGKFEEPETTHVLHRGDPMQKREVVLPAGIDSIEPNWSVEEDQPEGSRRIALAEWIASEKNPLTARVLVNRLWHYQFGTGLVATPSDFGQMGTLPSHPALLDWLAAEFIDSGWSIKHIQRFIVESATFRQSSRSRSEASGVDGDNRLLWRFSARRLEAEAIRDAILAVSGALQPRMHGPGFDLFKPNDNYVKVYTPREEFGPAQWRRMIYQTKPRMELDDTFGVFDCPDAAQPAPDRTESTTPLQAFNLLNSPFMLEQVDFFAKRLRTEAGPNPGAEVDRAFQLAFSRSPGPVERERAIELVREQRLEALCRALFNANEFLYLH